MVRGRARFIDAHTIEVSQAGAAAQRLIADRVLIATGRSPIVPGLPGLSATPYWTSTTALLADRTPEHLVVYGASVVALELAQAFLRLGSKVTLIARSTLLSKEDPAISAGLQSALEVEGMRILTCTQIQTVSHDGTDFHIDTGTEKLKGDRLLIATGRQANTANLGLELAGVAVDSSGAVVIDEHMRTSVSHIFAAGDCTNQPQYVYVAAAAGTRAARNMMGGNAVLDLTAMPTVVFTDPQVATVGLSEDQARAEGFEVDSRTLALENVPRALANFDTTGFVKLVSDKTTGRLIGAQILSAEAGEMIQTAVLAIRNRMDETGVDFAMDVHGDEAIPVSFLAGFEGIPSWTDQQGDGYYSYEAILDRRTPDFQTEQGYTKSAPGKANLAMSTNQVAERFGATSMTLEMPYKDNPASPEPEQGWSPERCKMLARDCLASLLEWLETREG